MGIEVADAGSLTPFIGPPLIESYMKYYGFNRGKALEAAAYYREFFSARGIFENIIYDGIPELLRDLKADGRQLFIVTFKPTEFSERIAVHFGINGYFTSIVGTDMSERVTSKVELIDGAVARFALNRNETVMIGDREHDISGAKGSGIASIAAGYGYGSKKELMAAGPDYFAADIGELRGFLLGGKK